MYFAYPLGFTRKPTARCEGGEDVLRIVYAALYAGVVGVAGVVA